MVQPYIKLIQYFDYVDIGIATVRQDLWRRLVNRQHLLKAIQGSPTVTQLKIERPVFIIGLYSSGTTHLHRLLAEDPRFRAPYLFEMLYSVPSVFENEVAGHHNAQDPRLRKACIF